MMEYQEESVSLKQGWQFVRHINGTGPLRPLHLQEWPTLYKIIEIKEN